MSTTSEAIRPVVLSPGQRVAVVAGNGRLPVDIVEQLVRLGQKPVVAAIDGEADIVADPAYDMFRVPVEHLPGVPARLKRMGVTHLVMAGGVARRPAIRKLRFRPGLILLLPRLIAAYANGDDGLLRALIGYVESFGIKVVGPHQIVPDLIAGKGAFGAVAPRQSDWRDIDAGFTAAKAIGELDIGQAAIAIGGRAVALEGIEGTDGLLQRTVALRGHGRLAGRERGVLVKCAKPDQELRVDLPTIGPQTVDGALAAGLAGIAVEAGRALILDQGETMRRADAAGLFVIGVDGAPQ